MIIERRQMIIDILIGLVALILGSGIGYLVRHRIGKKNAYSLESLASRKLDEASQEADSKKKEGEILAKSEVLKAKESFEKTTKARRQELEQIESRISQRELNLDRKVTMLDKKGETLDAKQEELKRKEETLNKKNQTLSEQLREEAIILEKLSGMTQDEAKELILDKVEKAIQIDIAGLTRRLQEDAKTNAEREARKIIAMAVQRYAVSHSSQMMTSAVMLPSEDMKGRIIGRDGRNIRSLEAATGVNILIDDTPEAVVISGFDSIRREIARLSLESLIQDGRIHPSRIEEVVEKTRENMKTTIREAGEEAAYMCSQPDIEPEILKYVGRLKFRTSYTQNVLQHSIEVANLMGVMAGELGLDPTLAKRIGLFHDIGKAVDHEVEGGHAIIGAELLKKFGEDDDVVNAVAAHHNDVEAKTLYAALASAADAISSSRPGARSESTDFYVKRLEKLEALSYEFPGVQTAYAIQAGREIRIIVDPEEINDVQATTLARDISNRIETELKYPGQIRVVVIREKRCLEYAK